ncbi:MAG: type II toxin-antitoxin system RelE/ParE family toxin [Candidatus Thiodiazotropha sp. (ex Ustalcina ferruginea)]|nr:type II toxin-antitoxin system RelE/ParE family toxin [Candidatus Thiodiazotropha sp. (ex Ustalcina ferruginea)]
MKDILWMGSSFRTLVAFPKAVKQVVGFQLHLIQQGIDADDWKPMSSIGASVREIRIHVEGTYRIIYLAKFDEGIYVRHAFQKKTQKTAKKDIDIARTRLHEVIKNRTRS